MNTTSLFLRTHHAHSQEKRKSELSEINSQALSKNHRVNCSHLPWIQKPLEHRPGQEYFNKLPWASLHFI